MHPGCFRDRDLSHDRLGRLRVRDDLRVRRLGQHLVHRVRHRRRARCRVLRRDRGLELACSAQSSSSSMGWGEVRPGVVPVVDLLSPLHRMHEVASGLASAFPANSQTGCCPDAHLDHLGHPGCRGDCRTSVRRVLPAWAFPVLVRRGCFRGEPASDRLASEQRPAWVPNLASEQHLASARSTALRAWPAQLRARWEPQLRRCQRPWRLQLVWRLRPVLLVLLVLRA